MRSLSVFSQISILLFLAIGVSGQTLSKSKHSVAVPEGSVTTVVNAPVAVKQPGDTFNAAITTTTITGKGIISYQFDLAYNSAVLQYNNCSTAGTISAGASPTCNLTGPGPGGAGKVTVVIFQATPMVDTTPGAGGVLINLNFTVIGALGTSSALTFQNFFFNECNFSGCSPASTAVSGTISVGGTTAANVTIAGRVLAASGRSVSGARVFMIDSPGNVRYTVTNGFGFYRFEDVPAGGTSLITVTSKHYTFAPKTLNVFDEFLDVDFVSEQ